MNSQFLDFKIIKKVEKTAILAQCTGKNSKGVFLFYNEKEQEQVPFLRKILAAVQLDVVQDVLMLVGADNSSFSLNDFRADQQITKVIVFDYLPSQLGLQVSIKKYSLTSINNCQYLFADSLEKIAGDKALKGQLWSALKQLF